MLTLKALLFLILLVGVTRLMAQDEIKVFAEPQPTGVILYASNSAYCPVSLTMELVLENMEMKEKKKEIYLVPERSDKVRLVELVASNLKKRISYSFHFRFNIGDVTQTAYDVDYAYDLPFRKGKKFMVFQGYDGKASHQGQKALDFPMPEGTEIVAVRGGVVVRVQEGNEGSCPQEECKKLNNYVVIYHADGTMAEYTHIRKNGAKVELGDSVRTGDLIAYSGNTGMTTGPHLHFVCFLQGRENRNTLPTKFKVDDGNKVKLLEEKAWYMRNY